MNKLIFISLFLHCFAFSQVSLTWVKEYNAGFDDYAQAVATDNESNIVVGGVSYNGTDFDCLTVKYNSSGDTLWTKRFDSGGSDIAKDVAIDNSGNIIIAGSSRLDNIYDYLIIKYDCSGNLIWVRRYQNGLDNLGMAVDIDNNQDIIVTGYANNGVDYDFLTIKYSPAGDTIWSRWYDAGFNDISDDVGIDSEGNVIVGGSSYDSITQMFTALVIKYNSNGDSLWAKQYLPPGYYDFYMYGLDVDGADNIVIAGATNYCIYRLFMVKYMPSGDTVWSCNEEWFYEFRPRDITIDSSNNIYVTGIFNKQHDIYSYDFRAGKFSPNGESLWVVTYPGGINEPNEFSYGIAVDLFGNIYITGYKDNGSDFDYLTVKYSEAGSIAEASDVYDFPQGLQLNTPYPNPFNNHTCISFKSQNVEHANIMICNAVGQMVKQFTHLTNHQSLFHHVIWSGEDDNGRQVPSGVYFVRLETPNKSITKKIIKLK